MSQEKLQEIKEMILSIRRKEKYKQTAGIGIPNVIERIYHIYKDAHIIVRSSNSGTKINIILRIKR